MKQPSPHRLLWFSPASPSYPVCDTIVLAPSPSSPRLLQTCSTLCPLHLSFFTTVSSYSPFHPSSSTNSPQLLSPPLLPPQSNALNLHLPARSTTNMYPPPRPTPRRANRNIQRPADRRLRCGPMCVRVGWECAEYLGRGRRSLA